MYQLFRILWPVIGTKIVKIWYIQIDSMRTFLNELSNALLRVSSHFILLGNSWWFIQKWQGLCFTYQLICRLFWIQTFNEKDPIFVTFGITELLAFSWSIHIHLIFKCYRNHLKSKVDGDLQVHDEISVCDLLKVRRYRQADLLSETQPCYQSVLFFVYIFLHIIAGT